MRRLIGLAAFALLLMIFGLAGESDRQSLLEARYMAALAHLDAAREVGR